MDTQERRDTGTRESGGAGAQGSGDAGEREHRDLPRPVPGPGRGLGGYVAVALVALTIGAAATVGVLRWRGGGALAPFRMPAAVVPPAPAADDQPVPDGEGIYISPARQQLIGVRTATVEVREIAASIRATGTLAYDETKVTQVHTKIAGWIEDLFVDFTGKPVRRGQPLFTIYSPDLVATQNEYLLARKAQDQLASSRFEETRQGGASLLSAARKRLELWDVTPAQIAELERTGEPRRTLTVFAPAGGIVLERNAYSGQYITPETTVFTLVELSTIWALGQVFDSDLGRVRLGQPAIVELSNAPGSRPPTGRVSFIYPDVDPATRRGRIRVEIPNPDLALKPEMFVTITLQTGAGRALAVPAEAVIDTGLKQYVILAKDRGFFEPRVVRTGAPAAGYYPVLEGLREGDRVVTSAQFLVDSETNLQAAMQAMADMPGMEAAPAGGPKAPAAPAASVDFRTPPASVRVGANTFEAFVATAAGEPVTDAEVRVTFFMAAMPSVNMPAMRLTTPLVHAGGGVYRGTGQVPMAGRWDVTVAAARGGAPLATRRLSVLVK